MTRGMCLQYPEAVFLGGALKRASVRIRCLQVAEALGCEYILDVSSIEQVPKGKRLYFCVKPDLSEKDIVILSRRGTVVWDIHDFMPPKHGVSVYLACSRTTTEELGHLGTMKVIPQHHCNFMEIPNPPDKERRPAWIGRPFWCPEFDGFSVDVYNANELGIEGIIAAYRQMGLSLNVRRRCKEAEFHVRINDGGKLINCMAFGIPSVSDNEPAYHEYGHACTLFAEPQEVRDAVHTLQTDDKVYAELRSQGLEKARPFHLKRILPQYRELIQELLL